MRILIFAWKDLAHPSAGGAEVFTHEVARELIRRGHRVTVFAAGINGAPAYQNVGGVDIVRAGGRLTVYREARRFWSREGDAFDVVVDEINTRPFMTPRWIREKPIVALIFQLAREVWFTETPFPVAALGRYVLEPRWLRPYRSVPAITISESSAESLRVHHGWKDVTIVPVGLGPIGTADVPKESTPTVVFLGRLVGMKRPNDAIEAFSHLRAAFPDARLWIIGSGPLEERLRSKAPPGVKLLGRVSSRERAERLARAHVLVATSLREGWGLNVSEAAACGTPSIAYAVPGLRDSVSASDGALVDPRPAALGHALVRFFRGELRLAPRADSPTWSDVAHVFERRLDDVVDAFRPGVAVGSQRRARSRSTFPRREQPRKPGSR